MRDTENANLLKAQILKEWEENGWKWDTQAGQACIRLAPIISRMLTEELIEIKSSLQALSDVWDCAEFEDTRAKDAVLLYKTLKRCGMSEDGLSYAVHGFLTGEKQPNDLPNIETEME